MSKYAGDRCRLLQAFWRAAERMGLHAPALLRQARLPAALYVAPDTWLTTAQYFAPCRAVKALSQDTAIGLRTTAETSEHPPATMSAFFCQRRSNSRPWRGVKAGPLESAARCR
jgi:hypothetical protein